MKGRIDELDEIIDGWIGARGRDEVVRAFNEAGVSLAAVDGLLQVAANPHFRARGNLAEVTDEEAGLITTSAPSPVGLSEPGRIRHLGRALGVDNHAVYCDWLGLDEKEMRWLGDDGSSSHSEKGKHV